MGFSEEWMPELLETALRKAVPAPRGAAAGKLLLNNAARRPGF
jgi:hypothetical protein